jgi:hypothetical protein
MESVLGRVITPFKYHFVVAVWSAKETESRRVKRLPLSGASRLATGGPAFELDED